MIRKIMLSIGIVLATVSSEAQESCASNSQFYWEWPSHNNWYVGNGSFINFTGGSFGITSTGNSYPSYEGTTAISDDSGVLSFFGNGPNVWNALGVKTCNNCIPVGQGGTGGKNSAAQGIIAVRHPLNPNDFYIFSTDDAVTSQTSGFAYTTFDASGNLKAPSVSLGNWRTTEGVTATLHDNGIDIWVSVVRSANAGKMYSYLITCDGVSSTPIISSTSQTIKGDSERGAIEFSPDGSKAVVTSQSNANPDHSIYLYDFDNSTGVFSNGIGISAVWGQWWWLAGAVTNVYDVEFSPDGNRIYVSGGGVGSITTFDISSGNKNTIYNSKTVIGSGGSFGALEMGGDGNIYHAGYNFNRISGNLNSGAVSFSKVNGVSLNLGLPNMFLPPLDEPDIHEVGPYCDTDPAVDLNTTWICSGLSAEDQNKNPTAYSGNGIVNQATGIFDPSNAGVGTHEVIFTYCNVNDTILIVVNSCKSCTSELKDTIPEICVGETFLLDGLVTNKSNEGVWTIDSFPLGTSPFLTSGTDTVFNATDINVTAGTYKLLFTVNDGSDSCYDSVYIVVNSLPLPDLGVDTSVCLDASPIIFNAGSYSSYTWYPNGETTQTISTITTGEYIISVIDANGCEANDSVNLMVHNLPLLDLGPDITVCPKSEVILDAGVGFETYSWSDLSNLQTVNVSALNAGEFNVLVFDANNCSARDTIEIIINTNPIVDLGSDVTICPGSTANFDAGNFSSYEWHNGSISQNYVSSVAEFVHVEVVDTNGCIARDSAEIFMSLSLPVNLGNDTSICDGSTLTLNTLYSDTGYTFLWNNGITSSDISVTETGTYGVIVKDLSGCSGSDSIELVVHLNPILDLGPDIKVCPTFDSTFIVGSGWINILWNNGSITESINVSQAGIYYADVIDSNGCSATDTILFDFFNGPIVDIGPDVTICSGSTANFDAGIFPSYEWNNGSIGQTYMSAGAEVVHVEVVDTNGCIARDSAEIFVSLSLPVNLGNDTAVCSGDSITFNSGYPVSGYSFLWNNGASTPGVTVKKSGVYSLVVQDSSGCSGSDSIDFSIKNLPLIDLGNDKVLCEGDSTTFQVNTSFNNIEWSTSETSQNISVKLDGSYSVIVTGINNCVATDTVNLSINNNPIVNLGSDQTVCSGSTVTFDAGIYSTYTWHDGSTLKTYSTKIEEEIYVAVQDSNGCFGSDTVSVFVGESLIVDLGSDTSICEGNLLNIYSDYGTDYSFSWNTLSTAENITVANTGVYGVEVTDSNGCKGSDSIRVIVNTKPIVALGPDTTICEGDSILFDAGLSGHLIEWNDLSSQQVLEVNKQGIYSVIITDSNGCIGRDSVVLSINNKPIVNLGNDIKVCPGENAVFKTASNSFASYLWQDGSVGETFTTSKPEVITILVKDFNGCVGKDTVILTNFNSLEVKLPADQKFCEGDNYTISVPNLDPSIHTFLWNTGSTQPTITVNNSALYNVVVENSEGCKGFDTIRIDVSPKPLPQLRDTSICLGETATFNGGIYQSYEWTPNGETGQIISAMKSGNYSVKVTDTNGCEGSALANLTVYNKPIIPSYPNQQACEGKRLILDPTLPIGTYLWMPNKEITSSIIVSKADNYKVIITNSYDCKDSLTINVLFNTNPIINLGNDTSICEGDNITIGEVNGVEVIDWNTGVVADELNVKSTGEYISTITDANGCVGKDTINIIVNPNPILSVSPDTFVCMKEIGSLKLEALVGNRDQIIWSTGETTNDIIITEESTFYVTATNDNECSTFDTIRVEKKCISELFVPNSFTPNGDRTNDLFGPVGFNIYEYDFYIFDRWGEEIFHSSDINNKWDGTYLGRPVQVDVYVWKVYYRTEESYGGLKKRHQFGTVTVLR